MLCKDLPLNSNVCMAGLCAELLFAHYLDDKSFGEVVFTKLKRAKHERPGREVVFWGLQNFLQRNGEGGKKKTPTHFTFTRIF